MVLAFFKGSDEGGLEHIETQIIGMLADCRHTFDVAMGALIGGGDPQAVGDDVGHTDQRINDTEQRIRRELVIHASVHGTQDVPTVLNYILVTKKLERIGDQHKNIFDLALEGVSFVGADDLDRLVVYKDTISTMFGEVSQILTEQDLDAARELMERGDAMLDEFDDLVVEQVHARTDASQAVPRALLYRYLKRVVANLANVTSSIVSPVDQLDYHEDGTDADM
jgi:phosphate transport system protein